MSDLNKINNFLLKLQSVPLEAKIFFVRHLGVMTKAGISLGSALKTLSIQTTNKKFKNVLSEIQAQVNQGESFAQALARYPKIFGTLFINMIQAGETSGSLEEILERIFKQMKKDHELMSKIKAALIYPTIVILAMIGIGIFMVTFVLPKITLIFKETDLELPIATRALIATSDFVVAYGHIITPIVVVLLITLAKIISTLKGKHYFHLFLLKTPITGRIIKNINLARFARTFSSLIKTDIPIIRTFKITSEILGNIHYQKALQQSVEKIKKGEKIAKVLAEHQWLFPAVVLEMISVGEETGTLEDILEELAIFYEEEVSETMTNLPSIIEPVLILILGAAVAVMAIAVIMPMYSLTQQI